MNICIWITLERRVEMDPLPGLLRGLAYHPYQDYSREKCWAGHLYLDYPEGSSWTLVPGLSWRGELSRTPRNRAAASESTVRKQNRRPAAPIKI
jgi:hypothetical protein